MDNIKIIKDLQNRILLLEEEQEKYSTLLNQWIIDKQTYVRSNDKIKPGIGSKVAFDENGLILSKEELSSSDIPNIEIDKVNGLRDILSNKASRNELMNIGLDYDKIFEKRSVEKTGTKVNIDKYGVVQSITNLTVEDIPELPLEKINGLFDKIKTLTNNVDKLVEEKNKKAEPVVSPGSGCKLSYNKYGNIIGTSKLDMSDVPIEIINRLNMIDSKMVRFVTVDRVDNLSSKVDNKIDKINPVKPGVYSKVKVDKNGLIVEGSDLSISDLNIEIKDIKDLYSILQSKADHTALQKLSSTVSKVVNSLNNISNIKSLENKLENYVDKKDLIDINNKIDKLSNSLIELNKIDLNMILEQVNSLRKDIIDINGRISVLESKILK